MPNGATKAPHPSLQQRFAKFSLLSRAVISNSDKNTRAIPPPLLRVRTSSGSISRQEIISMNYRRLHHTYLTWRTNKYGRPERAGVLCCARAKCSGTCTTAIALASLFSRTHAGHIHTYYFVNVFIRLLQNSSTLQTQVSLQIYLIDLYIIYLQATSKYIM